MSWFDRIFSRRAQPAPAAPPRENPAEAGPAMFCSGCFTICSGPSAHVIPWWNDTAEDFLTTFRCERCWLKSLDETFGKITDWDDGVREKFCQFLDRHRLADTAREIRAASLPEGSRLAGGFLALLRGGEYRLSP
jgi:hypothetical protein